MAKKKGKILVAMSGGVDSSVAAALLVNAGYDVTGMFAVNYESEENDADIALAGRSAAETCWRGDYNDALRVAAKLKIPLLRLNFVKEYKKHVLDYMYAEYRAGRTPNPDVLCNKFVKFGVWLKKAKELGFDKIATGHYARLRRECQISNVKFPIKSKIQNPKPENICMVKAKDDNKDQTYFLHQLTQTQLKHVLFPIGKFTKPEVRALADKFKLPTAKKEESMGICFVGEVPMKKFLMKKIKTKKGKIILSSGEIVGEHDGLAFYTIGERIGIAGHNEKPLYVVDKNIKQNKLVVGYDADPLLFKKEIKITETNWIAGRAPKFPLKCEVRLRHRQPLQKCVINKNKVLFTQPQRAVTPGQFAVFYAKGVCLGGGVIS
ncbi:MAG: tRNA 2-thiouridine(34) synthase MnmA [Patescibacteria group bacterium]